MGETVVLAGFLTNCCVQSTMRTAYEKGFNVITLTDAMATTSTEGQAVTGGSFGMFSTPLLQAHELEQLLPDSKSASLLSAEYAEQTLGVSYAHEHLLALRQLSS